MAEAERLRIERQVGLGVIVAVIVQAGAVLLWAGSASARLDEVQAQLVRQGPIAERLASMGYDLMGTSGTAAALASRGIMVEPVRKIAEGRPNLLDHLANGQIALVVNTPSGKGARTDEGRIRSSAVSHGVPCITTIAGARAAVAALERLRQGPLDVYALQDLLKVGGAK